MQFDHERLDADPPCGRLGFCVTSDLTGNGLPDVIVGGMGRSGRVNAFGKEIKLRQLPLGERIYAWRESNVFWYENPGWERHEVATLPDLSVGGSLGDVDGDGDPELVVGRNSGSELFWLDPPEDPRQSWDVHLITDRFRKYHDTAVVDVDGDAEDELVILSQESEVVCYFDIPDDPTISPWPGLHVIAEDLMVEGVGVADLDGDGRPDVVAGANVFSRNGSSDAWERRAIADDWEWTRIAIDDLDGDGRDEIVMSEGDLPYQGDRLGRLGIVDTSSWSVRVLDDALYCPHTIQLADLTGDERMDIVVGEMALGDHERPRLFVYRNTPTGFEREEISAGIATHEAKVVDLTGDGDLDIVGKSYGPRTHVDAWIRRA